MTYILIGSPRPPLLNVNWGEKRVVTETPALATIQAKTTGLEQENGGSACEIVKFCILKVWPQDLIRLARRCERKVKADFKASAVELLSLR